MRMLFVGLAAVLLAGQALAASPQEARQWLATLDQAVEKSNQVMQSGDPRQVAAHSRYIMKLRDSGEKFGKWALDGPYGQCFKAGNSLHVWWQEVASAAISGKESTPGILDQSAKWYMEARKDCQSAIEKEERLAGSVNGSPQEVRLYVQSLDDAVNAFEAALEDKSKIIQHSKHMSALADDGEKFGGVCFLAGINAQDLWLSTNSTTRAAKAGKEVHTDKLNQAVKNYADARASCLDAVAALKTK